MAIATKCAGCGKPLNIPDICIGRKIMCRHCGVFFVMAADDPSAPILWEDWTHGVASSPMRPIGKYLVPRQGQVGTETYQNLIAVSDTGVYESVDRTAVGTPYFRRVRVQSGSFRPIPPPLRRKNSSVYQIPVVLPTVRNVSSSDKTHKYAPVGMPALGYRKVGSSAQVAALPTGRKNRVFNLLQIGSIAALLLVSVLGFVFFFGPNAPPKSKPTNQVPAGGTNYVPANYTVKETVPLALPPVPAVRTETVKPPEPAPVNRTAEVQRAEKAPQPPATTGAFESINRAMSALPGQTKILSTAEKAEIFSRQNQHLKSSILYGMAAEESELAGRSEEAQLFALKSIEEIREYRSDIPRLPTVPNEVK